MKTEDREDLQLVKKIKAGDLDAFGNIIEKYQKVFYNLAHRILLDREDAEDVVQDSFIRIYENIHNFDQKYRFYSWASTIVVNNSLNIIKTRRIKLEFFKKSKREGTFASEPDKIIKDVIKKEKTEIAKELLRKIPVEYRVSLILRAYEELSYDEIAKRLGVSVGTVMSRISRGRKKILELLKEYN